MAPSPHNATFSPAAGQAAGGRRGDLRPRGRSRTQADPYLKSMLLRLIEESYLSAGTFTEFAAEVLEVLAYAVTVPVAFTEGFLKAYLSVDRVVEDGEGRITIIPRRDAALEDVIRDADAILAQVDGGAVFDPVVRSTLRDTHQVSGAAMMWDLDELAAMDDGQLMEVLRAMQAESERGRQETAEHAAATTDHIRARIATIRRNVQRFTPPGAARS
jgi:hypothetical protein